jgi:uncharacterized metal-binding protein
MSGSEKCACEPSEVLFFPCSGGSNCGQVAHYAAVELHKAGRGKLFCLAGIGGHVKGLIESAKAAKVLVAIDGCPALCAKKTLDHAELPPQIHLVVTELGIEKKSGYLDFSDEELAVCRDRLAQELQARVAGPAADSTSVS